MSYSDRGRKARAGQSGPVVHVPRPTGSIHPIWRGPSISYGLAIALDFVALLDRAPDADLTNPKQNEVFFYSLTKVTVTTSKLFTSAT